MTSFLETFGSSAVSPSEVAFAAYSFSTSLTLYWPAFSAGQTNIAARFMNLTATNNSLNVSMPDATLVSVGYDVIIFNAGSDTFNVVDFEGGAIATIATGQTYYIILNNNTTQEGNWQTVQFGVGTGSASAAALAGAGLLAAAGLLNVNLDATTIGGSTTLTSSDRAILQVWTGGAGTLTLPTAASVGDGFFFPLANNGSGSITVATSGGDQIDGESTSVFSQTQSAFIISSGSAWYTVGKGIQNTFSVTLLNLNVAGSADITETSAQAQNIIQQYTGILTGNINIIVPDTVQLYYVFNNTTGAHTLTVKTSGGSGVTIAQGAHSILYCDGTNVINAFTSSFGGAISIAAGSATAPNFNIIGSLTTGIYSPSSNQLAITANGKEVMNFISDASAVNWLQSEATSTGNAPIISAVGSDTNIGIILSPKGSGAVGMALAVILGGTIDGTIIGGSSAAAITGTSITANTGFVGNVTGNITGNVTGNSSTATALQNARTIGGVSFNGTANITVASATGGFTISGGDLALSTNNITMTGSLGATGARLTKGWFADLQVTNTIVGSVTGNAATVTTNANLTGVITSSGNATSIASQTGTGTKFVVDTSPTLITPVIGVASGTSLALGGATIGTDALGVTGTVSISGAVSIGAAAPDSTYLLTTKKSSAGAVQRYLFSNSGNTSGTVSRIISQVGGTSAMACELAFDTGASGMFTGCIASNGNYQINIAPVNTGTASIQVHSADGSVYFPVIGTTASAANAFLNSGSSPANNLLRSTSSIKYKTDIEDLQESFFEKILSMRPIWYRSLSEADPKDWSYYGFIAEEVAKIEPRFVHYGYQEDAYEVNIENSIDDNGNPIELVHRKLKESAQKVPDGIQYDRLVVPMIALIQKQQKQIEALQKAIGI